MIIHSNKLIFLHIPKTGGTSIENMLCPKPLNPFVFNKYWMFGLVDNQYSQHFNYTNIQKYCNTDISDYFIFAVVRNTWDRLVSAYKYLYENLDFEKFITNKCIALQQKRLTQTDHFNTQMAFIKNEAGKIVPDFIGRFENLQTDFDYMCDINHLKKKKLYTINKSNNKKHYSLYYTDKTRDLVNETYREEIEFFDFKFQQPL